MGSLSKQRGEKHCNYCKNHGIYVLEKDHGENCTNKSCTCKLCKQTYKKTLNTRRWRQQNAAKNIAGNGGNRKLSSTAAFKKGIHEYLAFKNGK